MKYKALNPDLYRLNRKRFASRMKPDSIAIFHSNDTMPRSGDQSFPFRQNSSLFGLSGLDQEETVLVLFPNCIKDGHKAVAFIKRASERMKTYDGDTYSKEKARKISGIKKIYWLDEMDKVLNELILLAKRIYIDTNENSYFSSSVTSRNLRKTKELMERYPAHKYHRSQPIMKEIAMIKSYHEIEAIQEAIDITDIAFRRVLDFVKPGVMEYEIEAEIIHQFIRNRASGHAYQPIVASGKNACILHYINNNQRCEDGDLLLMDFGAEYANYAADLSRTIPVNGQYSKRQRAVYDAVYRVMVEARQMLVPGTTMEDYHKEVGRIMQSELLGLKLISKTDIKNQDPEKPAYKKYFMHGTSHHLGLDVHDLSSNYVPIQAGMVFTCEPGIYIPEEKIGVRIENNILVTDNEPIDLMANIPVEAEEIETLMNAKVLSS